MSIASFIAQRGITKIIHFTTSTGFLGMIAGREKNVLPRKRLDQAQHLEYIATPNTAERADIEWLDYVNLSITKINPYFFRYSLERHPLKTWAVLEFSPEILSHAGVIFATTNNIYSAVSRGSGLEGLKALFIDSFNNGKCILRRTWHRPEDTTCNQAEVLYPGPLSLDYLNIVHVKDENARALLTAQMNVCCSKSMYNICISPEFFSR